MVESRFPTWIRAKAPQGPNYLGLQTLMRDSELHTVCEEAHCPNIGDCWERRTATFMILGDTCTWRCHYCAVKTGRPLSVDFDEPARLARTVRYLDLKYCVITSVTREDLEDGGSSVFAECIYRIREATPMCKVEVLVPDFKGRVDSLQTVVEAKPEVLNHNIETVRSVFRKVRPKGEYDRSLQLLRNSQQMDPLIPTKSGIMVGLGETLDEIKQTMEDLLRANCRLLTIGQYLQPSKVHWKIQKFYSPEEFEMLKQVGMDLGFRHVASGPLVRSSYHADEQAAAAHLWVS